MRNHFLLIGFSFLLAANLTMAQPAVFNGLWISAASNGDQQHTAAGVSDDGTVIVGTAIFYGYDHTPLAYRWNGGNSENLMGWGPGFPTDANAVSADGNNVAGFIQNSHSGAGVRWNEFGSHGGYLAEEVSDGNRGYSNDISADGGVMVGRGRFGTALHEEYGELEGMSEALGVSDDGQSVAGYVDSEDGFEAQLWTLSDSTNGLGFLHETHQGVLSSKANAVSGDGSVVVGYSSINGVETAFRWTSSEGMVALDSSNSQFYRTVALDVSADGSTIIGFGITPGEKRAFIWDEVNGIRDLEEVMVNELSGMTHGWSMTEATAISRDGKTIVGNGIDELGRHRAWRIQNVPEPASGVLLCLGALASIRRRDR